MLRYDQISVGGGGPWIGSVAIPGLQPSSVLPRREIIDRIKSGKNSENLALTGSDPLLHPDIHEIIRAAGEAGYKRMLARTSGHHFDDINDLAAIIKTGLTLFEVMLWGDGDSRSAVSDLFQKQYRGMRNIRRISERSEGLQNIFLSITIPVGKDNHGRLKGYLAKAFTAFTVDRVVFCWGDPEFPIWNAAAAIQEAIDYCQKNEVWAVTRGIPICAVPEKPYHLEVLFHHDGHLLPLSLPPECGACCFSTVCSRMPSTHLPYRWEPQPIRQHHYAPFILDILEKGSFFDEASERLYSPDKQ